MNDKNSNAEKKLLKELLATFADDLDFYDYQKTAAKYRKIAK